MKQELIRNELRSVTTAAIIIMVQSSWVFEYGSLSNFHSKIHWNMEKFARANIRDQIGHFI